MTLISVILPFKNAASSLKAAIDSILEQTVNDLELILVNDHSEDQSQQIIDSFNDSRIKVIDNNGAGLVRALNYGINQANGEFIARMDADDLSYPKRLEIQLDHLKNSPDNYISACQVKYTYKGQPDINTQGYRHYVDWLNNILTPQEHSANRFVDAPIAHPTLFCRKEIFSRYGFYKDAGYPEDFELWLRWMDQGVAFEKVNSVLFEWTDHVDRLSRTHEAYSTDKFIKVKTEYLTKVRELNGKKIWIVGYGKEVFKRVAYLEDFSLNITGYVDIKVRPQAQRQVISFDEVKKSRDVFYLIYVSDRQGKKLILDFFKQKKMKAQQDYLVMA